MITVKSKTVYVDKTVLDYSVAYGKGRYRLDIKVRGESSRRFSACDVASDEKTAEYLLELFSDNVVFPENAPEILDDLLAENIL